MILRKSAIPRTAWEDASRVALGVCILAGSGFHAFESISPNDLARRVSSALQWGAITVVLLNQPLLGATTLTAVERCLGTFLGALLGFGSYHISSEMGDAIFLTVMAFLVPFCGTLLGHVLRLHYSFKLFSLTFIIGTEAWHVAVSRMAGIGSGILVMLLLACFVFPHSASSEVLHRLQQSMKAAVELNRLSWRGMLRSNRLNSFIAAPPASGGSGLSAPLQRGEFRPEEAEAREAKTERLPERGGQAEARVGGGPAAEHAVVLDIPAATGSYSIQGGQLHIEVGDGGGCDSPDDSLAAGLVRLGMASSSNSQQDERCEELLTTVLNSLQACKAAMTSARKEWYLGCCSGCVAFLPRLGRRSRHMPEEAVAAVGVSVRRLSRMSWQIHVALSQGFSTDTLLLLHRRYPPRLVPDLHEASSAALEEVLCSFPKKFCGHSVPALKRKQLDRLRRLVVMLLRVSKQQRHAVFHAVKSMARLQRVSRGKLCVPRSPVCLSRGGRAPALKRIRSRSITAPQRSPASHSGRRPRTAGVSQPAEQGRTPHSRKHWPGEDACSVDGNADGRDGVSGCASAALARTSVDASLAAARAEVAMVQRADSAPGSSLARHSLNSLMAESGAKAEGQTDVAVTEQLFFPDTRTGFLDRLRWTTFQFLMEQMAAELEELHSNLARLRDQLP